MHISLSTAGPKWRQRFSQTRLCSGQGALHSLLQVRMSIYLWLVQAFSMRLLLILRKNFQTRGKKLRTIFGQVPTRMKSRGGIEMDEAYNSYALQSRPTRRTCNKMLCSQITKFKVIKIWNQAHASMQG
jgi:hypothetical protein